MFIRFNLNDSQQCKCKSYWAQFFEIAAEKCRPTCRARARARIWINPENQQPPRLSPSHIVSGKQTKHLTKVPKQQYQLVLAYITPWYDSSSQRHNHLIVLQWGYKYRYHLVWQHTRLGDIKLIRFSKLVALSNHLFEEHYFLFFLHWHNRRDNVSTWSVFERRSQSLEISKFSR